MVTLVGNFDECAQPGTVLLFKLPAEKCPSSPATQSSMPYRGSLIFFLRHLEALSSSYLRHCMVELA
jgi:hypothetical protein